ncbi:MAG TPA: acireductone synthase [Terracidiphilus sp.]|nr:acireductone synthase [Terracidiphilus sp.]
MASAYKLYLLDIEGTVAPLTLTGELLFPYARKHLRDFLRHNIEDPGVHEDLMLLAEENRAETEPDLPRRLPKVKWTGFVDAPKFQMDAFIYLLWLMDRDRKSTALKSLQGKIWKAGFESGELKGALFADVPPAFERWAREGKVAIYSSGSVEAQKLLFRHSNYGDLTPWIAGYFDTRTGPKAESASYAAIAEAMQVEPALAIFFSDVVKELDAARKAGFETRLVVREGNPPVEDPHGHERISSLEGF